MTQQGELFGTPVLMKLVKEAHERQNEFVGFEIVVCDNIFEWEIRFRPDEMADTILVNAGFLADYEKFKTQTKRNYLEGRLYFPQDYPRSSVFFRFVYPRLSGAHLCVGGCPCAIYTDPAWKPPLDIFTIIPSCFEHALKDENVRPTRIDLNCPTPYPLEQAVKDRQSNIPWIPALLGKASR
jgi:hypothetical protein